MSATPTEQVTVSGRGSRRLEPALGHRHADALGNALGLPEIGIGHQHHELLAAEAAGEIDAADVAPQALREFLEHRVADIVAVIVVDRL